MDGWTITLRLSVGGIVYQASCSLHVHYYTVAILLALRFSCFTIID